MEYRLEITMTEFGRDEETAERFLDGFLQTHPEVGAVVSQNLRTGHLTLVFSLEAADPQDAWERGRPIFGAGAAASGLSADDTQVISLHVDPVDAGELVDSPSEAHELLPA